MFSAPTLLKLVEKIYSAASDSTQWRATLESLIEVVSANTAALEVRDFTTAGSRVAVFVNWQGASEEYEKYYAPKNILLMRGDQLMTEGSILTGDEVCATDEYLASEYYNDLLRPNDIRHMSGTVILRRASIGAVLVLGRPHRKPPFGNAEKHILHMLLPHLRSALQLHERLIQLEDQRRDLSNALDLLSFGVILVDATGKILLLNRSAERILHHNDGLTAGAEGLRASSHEQSGALRALIAGAAAATNTVGVQPGGVLSVPRPSLRRDYAVLVCPMRAAESRPTLNDRAAAAIFITDPDARCEPPPQLLMRLFGLTPAEARLAILLMEGETLAEAAEKIGITRNTAHSQLKAVFGKTGASRQSELVKLLLRGPAQIPLRAA
jgi:DNA-binding CsgD family transcriptional regulator